MTTPPAAARALADAIAAAVAAAAPTPREAEDALYRAQTVKAILGQPLLKLPTDLAVLFGYSDRRARDLLSAPGFPNDKIVCIGDRKLLRTQYFLAWLETLEGKAIALGKGPAEPAD